jgi:hypothetical protein
MRSPSLYRVCGNSLMAAGLLFAVALVLMPALRAPDLAAARSLVGAAWIVAAWLAGVGMVLTVAANIGIYRHFAGGPQEGWAVLALATALVGAILATFSFALNGAGQPALLQLAAAAPQGASLDPAQTALAAVASGGYAMGGVLLWLAGLPLGYAMLKDRAWPRFVAWTSLAIALVEEVAGFTLLHHHQLHRLVLLLGFAFLVYLGATFTRLGGLATAAPLQGSEAATPGS